MFKKAIPLVLMSGLALTACANNDAVPKNETPMEKVEDRTRELTPEVNDGQTGPNMDGLENERDLNDNKVINENNGVINEETTTTPNNGVTNDGTTNTPNEAIIENDLNPNTPNGTNR